MKITSKRFLEELENGWDNAIEYIEKNTKDKTLLEYVDNYYNGYNYCIDNDIDGGKCFEMREKAINDIDNYLNK